MHFDAADPKDLVPGTEVSIFGLSEKNSLYNGMMGVVNGPAETEGRFNILVKLGPAETKELSIKPANLRVIGAVLMRLAGRLCNLHTALYSKIL